MQHAHGHTATKDPNLIYISVVPEYLSILIILSLHTLHGSSSPFPSKYYQMFIGTYYEQVLILFVLTCLILKTILRSGYHRIPIIQKRKLNIVRTCTTSSRKNKTPNQYDFRASTSNFFLLLIPAFSHHLTKFICLWFLISNYVSMELGPLNQI